MSDATDRNEQEPQREERVERMRAEWARRDGTQEAAGRATRDREMRGVVATMAVGVAGTVFLLFGGPVLMWIVHGLSDLLWAIVA
jgi:hypothetical protein